MSGPIWLRWTLTVAGILLAGSRLVGLIGSWLAARNASAIPRPVGWIAVPGVVMPLGMAAMFSPGAAPGPMRDTALVLGALTAGFGIITLLLRSLAAPLGTTVAVDADWLHVELTSAAMVLAVVASHRATPPIEAVAMVPPLTYHFVCRAKRSLACALAGPARLHGYEFAASVAMIYMLLTVH